MNKNLKDRADRLLSSIYLDGYEHGYKEAISRISNYTSKTGQWVDGCCSICGGDIPAYIIDWKWQKDMDAKYCPNCGARMESKK